MPPQVSTRRPPLSGALASLAAVLAFAACGDDPDGTRLEMTPVATEIRAALNPQFAHAFPIRDVPTERARFAAETGTDTGEWSRVQPRRMSLFINESGSTWDFMEEVAVQLCPEDPQENCREIFYRDQLRENDQATRLDMIPSDIDVKGLLTRDDVTLVVDLRRMRYSNARSLPVVIEWSFEGFE